MYTTVSSLDLTAASDFTEGKWRGIFLGGLRRVSTHIVDSAPTPAALDHLEGVLLQLLQLLTARPAPHTVAEVGERVGRVFPPPIDRWAMDEAGSALRSHPKKSTSVFPVERVQALLQKEVLGCKVEAGYSIYLCAVLEYIAADILHLVGNYVRHGRPSGAAFTTEDVQAAMVCDKVLCDLFKLGEGPAASAPPPPAEEEGGGSSTYSEVLSSLLHSERAYLRDLQMLCRVFRGQLTILEEEVPLSPLFNALADIADLTQNLIGALEDALEMTEAGAEPQVGVCWLELAENWEFEIYKSYSDLYTQFSPSLLRRVLGQPQFELTLSTAGHGFLEASKFYFPRLLEEPLRHCPGYFEWIRLLLPLSPTQLDREDLLQAESCLAGLKSIRSESPLIPKSAARGRAVEKLAELRRSVEGMGGLEVGIERCGEFQMEGPLLKINLRRPSDRMAYLFDGYLFLAKAKGKGAEFRLKEFYSLARAEVREVQGGGEEGGGDLHLFELTPTRDQPPVLLATRTAEERCEWMGRLVQLTTKSMLDRILDRLLSDDRTRHPLQLPPAEIYRFAEPDSEANIVFDREGGGEEVIKGATLLKLVSRLTHHSSSDPAFNNTFLTTYRSFCTPQQFLSLLIERYSIPEPELEEGPELKRFRKEYARHVQLRVLNVIKQWILHHFYDFSRDPALSRNLESFLDTAIGGRRNFIFESVRRCFRRAVEASLLPEPDRSYSAVKSPPPIEVHIRCPVEEWSLLTLHPIELARQLTLLEFDYYRRVAPSELVGSVWTKKDKELSSPNLLRMIKHTTNVTRWFERSIVDTDNLEERVAIYSRILEVMVVMGELNNFNGVLAVVSAMGSASVHRLGFTRQAVSPRLLKALEEAQELQNAHYKRYQERLRSINPPCVPFFGMYLTNILHIEEGNSDHLTSSPDLINFAKRRKVAEITAEIRQFQYSHYTLAVEPKLRAWLEGLAPFGEMSENAIANYLYERSLELEPRGAKGAAKFARLTPDLPLKSPGIKPKHLPGRTHPAPLPTLEDTEPLLPAEATPTSAAPSPAEEDAVFVPVLIGGSYTAQAQQAPLPPPLPPRRPPKSPSSSSPPPPLPPRRPSPRTLPLVPARRGSSSPAVRTPNQNEEFCFEAPPPRLPPKK